MLSGDPLSLSITDEIEAHSEIGLDARCRATEFVVDHRERLETVVDETAARCCTTEPKR
ncbi:hypothetical protein WN55_01309 [Dufourea novaeangliae]|uniref:Uncharacterized protein n=1 Tax=Dufourea novaeangliae TaxID=178035 RepID=A0A154PEQ6_DUFNO|nr:hypothetical protein WN55_01309 [Dufourea novaeangliae]